MHTKCPHAYKKFNLFSALKHNNRPQNIMQWKSVDTETYMKTLKATLAHRQTPSEPASRCFCCFHVNLQLERSYYNIQWFFFLNKINPSLLFNACTTLFFLKPPWCLSTLEHKYHRNIQHVRNSSDTHKLPIRPSLFGFYQLANQSSRLTTNAYKSQWKQKISQCSTLQSLNTELSGCN